MLVPRIVAAWTAVAITITGSAVVGCGGDGTAPERVAPRTPATLEATTATSLSAPVASTVTVGVMARDASGAPMPGVQVSFSVSRGGGSVTPASAATDGGGVASGSWTLGTVAGQHELRVAATGLSPVVFTAAAQAGPASVLAKVSGDQQQGQAGAALPQPLRVRVTDSHGNPVTGAAVTFTVSSGGGAIEGSPATTGGDGLASAGPWTLGAGSAEQTVTAAIGTASVVFTATAVSAPPVVTFASVAAGGAHTCALTPSGAAYCWGRGESGQLGVPSPTTTCTTDAGPYPCSMVPVAVGGGLTLAQLAGGGAHTCGLTGDGSAYCWGSNASGQLGDNSTSARDAPVAVATVLKFASLDAGAQHTCGLTTDGAAYCWGRNDRGQLGDGTTSNRPVPVAVTGGLTFRLVAAGGFSIGHTCALTTSGDASCWGDNERGQLGRGTSDVAAHPTPAPVSGGLTFAVVTAGLGRHSCGRTAAGAAYCWGENSFGALGSGSTTDSPVPVPVSGGLAFVQLIAGGFIGHTCGLTGSGAAYCWGDNEVGQVGDGTTVDRLAPSAVTGGLAFTSLDAGFRHTCGRASTGTLYCWGSNGAGQLGTNSNSPSAVPVKVVGQP
jgi:alpha-tubulin suppressor-like RCC1 family protein